MEALLLAVDVQYTEQENCCSTMARKMWRFSILHDAQYFRTVQQKKNRKHEIVKHITISLAIHCISYSRYSHPAVPR
jgi:hypothetical protein